MHNEKSSQDNSDARRDRERLPKNTSTGRYWYFIQWREARRSRRANGLCISQCSLSNYSRLTFTQSGDRVEPERVWRKICWTHAIYASVIFAFLLDKTICTSNVIISSPLAYFTLVETDPILPYEYAVALLEREESRGLAGRTVQFFGAEALLLPVRVLKPCLSRLIKVALHSLRHQNQGCGLLTLRSLL